MRFILLLFFLSGLSFCLYSQFDAEIDFKLKLNNDGLSFTIIDYIGKKQKINIPPVINNLPVTIIGVNSFRCKQLSYVFIPASVTTICDYAFADNQLINILFSTNLTFIGKYAFANNLLSNLAIPVGSTFISQYAFANNKLTDVTIPASVSSIGHFAFYNNFLTKITIPDNVTYIGRSAFAGNPLTSITIGSGVVVPHGFNNSFASFYVNHNLKSGTYTFLNGSWVLLH